MCRLSIAAPEKGIDIRKGRIYNDYKNPRRAVRRALKKTLIPKGAFPMPHTEKTLKTEEIFQGHVFRVTLDEVELENGTTSKREIVHHHGGACVLPLTDDGRVLLVRQYRYALQEELWELPAGKLEAGEDPFEAARRELEEECGVTAETFISLGVLYPTVGYDSERIYIWAAKGLKPTAQHLDEGEFLDVSALPFDEVVQMVMNDEIRDSKTVAAVMKYVWLKSRGEG